MSLRPRQTHDLSPEERVCKLTSPEFTKRKLTAIASLKKQVVASRETDYGYTYQFGGSNEILDLLTDFIKTERQCCDFFTFTLTIEKEANFIWFELSGPPGCKEFIRTELEF